MQADGGSEFVADLDRACRARQIALYILPPRFPNRTGGNSRSVMEVASIFPAFRRSRHGDECEMIRPYQALGYETPYTFSFQEILRCIELGHPLDTLLGRG